MQLVVGLPAYNEEKNIAKVILELQQITKIIVVCDDGSTDLTTKIAEKMGAIVVSHPKNLGYGAAIRSIFLKAKELNADILVTFDADGQHRVQDISKVVEPIKANTADIVIGSRFLTDNDSVPNYRKFGIKAITKLTNVTTKNKVTDSQSGFRAYDGKVRQRLSLSDSGMGISTEILIKADKSEFRITEVPIEILYGGDTSTHNPVGHGISVILSTMKFISIERPLKFYGIPGLSFLGVGLFFIIWTLQVFGDSRQILTNIALIGIGMTIFGVMLLMSAIMLFSIVSVVRENKI